MPLGAYCFLTSVSKSDFSVSSDYIMQVIESLPDFNDNRHYVNRFHFLRNKIRPARQFIRRLFCFTCAFGFCWVLRFGWGEGSASGRRLDEGRTAGDWFTRGRGFAYRANTGASGREQANSGVCVIVGRLLATRAKAAQALTRRSKNFVRLAPAVILCKKSTRYLLCARSILNSKTFK